MDAKVAPEKLTLPDPAVAVMPADPQEPVSPFGAATTRPAGKLSIKPTPVSEAAALGLLTVKLRPVVPFSAVFAAPKVLVRVGGAKPGPGPVLQRLTAFVSSVTAPFRARIFPLTPAFVFKVMLVSATMLPINEVPVPRVADDPTCQDTPPQFDVLLILWTREPLAVVRVLPILKMKMAFGLFCALSVRVPVN